MKNPSYQNLHQLKVLANRAFRALDRALLFVGENGVDSRDFEFFLYDSDKARIALKKVVVKGRRVLELASSADPLAIETRILSASALSIVTACEAALLHLEILEGGLPEIRPIVAGLARFAATANSFFWQGFEAEALKPTV